MTNTGVAEIQQFSPDDGHTDARNMYRRVRNKYIKQNCAPSWIYVQDYTGMHGQQNIKPTNIRVLSATDLAPEVCSPLV